MIKLLDDSTIQKIAAGEVIERPSSIVKELLENSIDAKADIIQIEIEDGGKSLILISDNGIGIPSNQIETAFMRHATSKIQDFDDLYKSYTMGFRGEALASIIAVAKVDMKSKSEDEDLGVHIQYENSKLVKKSNLAMNTGTITSVKDLFKNIPVRHRFLKSNTTEANHITDLVGKLTLANPDVSLKYIKDKQILFNINSEDNHIEKIRKIFGDDLAKSLIEIDFQTDNFKVMAYISNNTYYRGNRALEYTYVNSRYIESKEISRIIESAYTHIIPNGKYPAYQIYIETKASNLDVNIHPNKTKIHLEHMEELTQALKYNLSLVLRPEKLRQVEIESEKKEAKSLFENLNEKYSDLINKYNNENSKDTFDKNRIENLTFDHINNDKLDTKKILLDKSEEDVNVEFNSFKDDNSITYDYELVSEEIDESYNARVNESEEVLIEENIIIKDKIEDLEHYKYKTFILETYIVFENIKDENIILLDQHASHERINYERLLDLYNNDNNYRQSILDGIDINLLADEMTILNNNISLFEKFGFTIEIINSNTISLIEVPAIYDINYKQLFLDLINGLKIYGTFNSKYLLDKLIQKACKSSIKAYDKISEVEAYSLIKELSQCDYPLTCPHGRPTFLKIKKSTLDMEFKRIK